jgi:hypothetical protein
MQKRQAKAARKDALQIIDCITGADPELGVLSRRRPSTPRSLG